MCHQHPVSVGFRKPSLHLKQMCVLLRRKCCCLQHTKPGPTLRVEPRNWMPLNASALLASCTLRSLMKA